MRLRNHFRHRLLGWMALFVACGAAQAAPGEGAVAAVPEAWSAGWEIIDEGRARVSLEYLAGPECAGRGTGQDGYAAAARYVAERFEALGLRPGVEGSFLQEVPFQRQTPDLSKTRLTLPGALQVVPGEGFGVSRASEDMHFSGEVVFVTARGSDAAIPEDLDLEGKALVVVSRDTGRGFMGSLFRSGAALRLSVTDEVPEMESRLTPVREGDGRSGRRGPGGPRVSLSRETARAMARVLRVDPVLVEELAGEGSGVTWQKGIGEISFDLAVTSEEVSVPNVVGVLDGADPALRHQHIGVGAHLDHLGRRGDVVYPGADDDGSGVTAVLLLAEALAKNPERPARSVVFMAFCGEEIGLIGSRYYAEHPCLPLEDMSCLLQMDMVGRNEESASESADENVDSIHVVGSQRLENRLHSLVLAANEHVGLSLEYDEEGFFSRSDHANFARKGVPVCFLFSGFHPDYHQPTDTIDKINFDKIVRTARLNYVVVHMVSALDAMLGRTEKKE